MNQPEFKSILSPVESVSSINNFLAIVKMTSGSIKPLKATNQPTKDLRAETCAFAQVVFTRLLSHSCADRIAGLSNGHLKL